MSQPYEENHQEEFEENPLLRKTRQRSDEYDRKRRRAESILEKARIREQLGFDVDFPD